MKGALATALAGALLAGGIAAADSATTADKVRSRVTIGHQDAANDFVGRVRSSAGVCKKNRRVKIFMIHDGPDMLAGAGRTNRRGRYDIDHEVGGAGDYYAKALKKVSGSTTCRPARSKSMSL